MSEPGFASLGPTLLARKGGAKPAMRPQIAPLVADEEEVAALADEQLEDLGWNDMGDGEGEHGDGADVVPINAAVAAADSDASQSPIVRRQQRRLEERVLADAVMTGPEDQTTEALDSVDNEHEPEADYDYDADAAEDDEAGQSLAPVIPAVKVPALVAAPARRPAKRAPLHNTERRAAFTLRLDPERHLKLRLAATMQGVSAQALLTEALDAMLAEFDDLDVIAAHLNRH
ncbi:MAG: type II toxin-antitoxin system HicB family antitoxin [Erythrobacteraceae bacterium]|jgi:hypothetical protein|nr:type II toxin-antitoxin system HicB family antitoxin [Erythrobacteraceae bacterium]